jgi:PAS domain S-box-containing protein
MKNDKNNSELAKQELIVINKLNKISNEGSPIDVVMEKATELIRQTFGFHSCGIFCLDNGGKSLVLRAISIDKKVLEKIESTYRKILGTRKFVVKGMKIPLYNGSTFKKVIDTKKYHIIDKEQGLKDYSDDKKIQAKAVVLAKILGKQTVLRAPLMAGDNVFGVLGASTSGELTKNHVTCVMDIASQMALIIKKHKIEEKVLVSEIKYRSLFQNAGDPILMVDKPGKILEFNDKACEVYGYSFQEMLGKDIRDFDVGMTADEMTVKSKEVLKYGYVIFETKHRKKDGTVIDVLVTGTKIKTIGGEVVQIISKDITKIKELSTYKEREKQLLLYMDAIDMAALPMVLWRLGEIVFANKKMTSLTGFTHEELKAISLRDIVIKKDRKYFDGLCKILFDYDVGVSSAGELTIINKRGDEKYVTFNQVKTDMGNGDPIFSTTIVDQNYTNKKLQNIDALLHDIDIKVEGITSDAY